MFATAAIGVVISLFYLPARDTTIKVVLAIVAVFILLVWLGTHTVSTWRLRRLQFPKRVGRSTPPAREMTGGLSFQDTTVIRELVRNYGSDADVND